MRKPRRRLSIDAILDAAIATIEAEGVDALTMRRLAARLGTTAMAFYNHFGDREALVDAIVERLYGELRVPAATLAWDDRLRRLLDEFLASGARSPRAWQVAMTRPTKPATGRAIGEAGLAALLDAGLAPADAEAALVAMSMLIRGMLLWNGEHCHEPAAARGAGLDGTMRDGFDLMLAGVRVRAGRRVASRGAARRKAK